MMFLDNQDYINPLVIIKESINYIIILSIIIVIIIIIGLIYNIYFSYPTRNAIPKFNKYDRMNQLKLYIAIDTDNINNDNNNNNNNNNNDYKINLDNIEINNSRNNSLLTPSLFKQNEFISNDEDDDDDNMSLISSLCDGIDIDNNIDNESQSSQASSIYKSRKNSIISEMAPNNKYISSITTTTTTSNNNNNNNVTSTSNYNNIYHYPSNSLDTFYKSMQQTINTITSFLKSEPDHNHHENQDLLSNRRNVFNLMRTNSKL
jgi:hypothetical protein